MEKPREEAEQDQGEGEGDQGAGEGRSEGREGQVALLVSPFKYRPEAPQDHNDGETDDWADNWLSNSLAWASRTFLPSWCSTEEHWTSKFMDYLYTTCPCCMLFRGIVVGFLLSFILWAIIIAFLVFLWSLRR